MVRKVHVRVFSGDVPIAAVEKCSTKYFVSLALNLIFQHSSTVGYWVWNSTKYEHMRANRSSVCRRKEKKITISTKFPSAAHISGLPLTSTQWHNISKVQRSSRTVTTQQWSSFASSQFVSVVGKSNSTRAQSNERATTVKFNVAFEIQTSPRFPYSEHFARVLCRIELLAFMWAWQVSKDIG